MRIHLLIALVLLLAVQARADEKWRWDKEPDVLEYADSLRQDGLKVSLSSNDEEKVGITVRNSDGKMVYRWAGHRYSSFCSSELELFVADYVPTEARLDVLAIELKSGRLLWKDTLVENDPNSKGSVFNRVNMRFLAGKLYVYSKQSRPDVHRWWVIAMPDGHVAEAHGKGALFGHGTTPAQRESASCPVHHTPLKTMRCYTQAPGSFLQYIPEFLELDSAHKKDLPCHVPVGFVPNRNHTFTQRTEVQYCPVCEEKWRALLASHDL